MDFSKEILVFTHVPKTGGQSLTRALRTAIGEERCVRLRMQKIENVRTSRFAELGVAAHVAGRQVLSAIQRRHYLLPPSHSGELSSIAMFHGHVRAGEEPRTGRRPTYVTVVRDPVDRFLSYFYYRRDQLSVLMQGKTRHPLLDANGQPPADPMEFLDRLTRSGTVGWRNAQCRYFTRAGDFESARRVIDDLGVIAAPMRCLDELTARISHQLDLPRLQLEHVNKGASRARARELSDPEKARIASHFNEDLRLYRYIEDRFDKAR